MLSPGYIVTSQSSGNQSVSLPLPAQCHRYQNMMPPPPNNILTTISSNNNNPTVKNYNRPYCWSNTKKHTKDFKNEKEDKKKDKKKETQENKNTCSRVLPENKGVKRLHEKNASQTIPQNDNSPENRNESLNHNRFYSPFYSSHNQRINQYQNNNRNRYFINRNVNKHRKSTVSPERQVNFVDCLMDRFLSRANIVETRKHPKELFTSGEFDRLSFQVWDYYLNTQQMSETYRSKLTLWKCLYVFIRSIFPKYGLFVVGSTMSGFGTNTSDVDMCLLVRSTFVDQRCEAINFLEQIQRALKNCDFVGDIELIWAKVPILKFRDRKRNIDVDLNCNNSVGIRNTHLLYCYANLDWRVRALVLVVKMWARSNNINDAKSMTISSYSLALMVIHFLQCGVTPPVIPCLHGLYPGKFHMDSDIHSIDMQERLHVFRSDNRQSLGELLLGFLNYYSRFQYDMYAISVRLGARVPIDECRMMRSYKNDPHQWKLLCIEEPFDFSNTARSVYDYNVFERVKNVFVMSYNKLKETRELMAIFNMDPINI